MPRRARSPDKRVEQLQSPEDRNTPFHQERLHGPEIPRRDSCPSLDFRPGDVGQRRRGPQNFQ
eukprot:8355851-Pyramimonas_sp.AAC.1